VLAACNRVLGIDVHTANGIFDHDASSFPGVPAPSAIIANQALLHTRQTMGICPRRTTYEPSE
jgi:hypothetical protein